MAEYPITTWPGSQYGYQPPMQAAMHSFGRGQMFDAHPGHIYQPPFNMNLPGGTGPLVGALMQQVAPRFLPQGMRLAQFYPQQNLRDQFQAEEFFLAGQQAAQIGATRDRRSMERMLGGITEMTTGRPMSQVQIARNANMASSISQFMPILSQVLGPDLIDQLHGSQGSATVMAQQLHHAMRTAMDPITGRIGYSGASSGRVTAEVFEQLFGENADVGNLRGLSAGQSGMVIKELQSRGLLGRPTGTLSFQEQRSVLSRNLADDTVNRIAETLEPVQKILQEGGVPSESVLAEARRTVRESHQKLTDPTQDLKREDLDRLPGGAEIIRSADADRITRKLKNLSGAVKAMRDIFGDAGNPNAPIQEIMNGLDQLTQGGLSSMSAGQLEAVVRKTHVLARQTGVGVQGIMALTSQNAGLADQLGLDRTFALRAAQQSVAFGAAAGDTLRMDIPVFGAASKEELTLADTQLRMQAAASPLTNQLNSIMRMADSGMLSADPGSEITAIAEAIRRGDTEYTFDGQRRSLVMPRDSLQEILQRDAGIGRSQSFSLLTDRFGNQEYGQRYNTEAIARQVQTRETAKSYLRPVFGNQFRGTLESAGINEAMIREGIIEDDTGFRQMMDEIGAGAGIDLFNEVDPEEIRNPARRREAFGRVFRGRLRAAVARRMPGASDQEIDAAVARMVGQLGTGGLTRLGEEMHATANAAFRNNPLLKDTVTAYSILHQETLAQGQNRERQAEAETLMQSALSGLGTAGPLRRIIDTLQESDENTEFGELMARAIGAVDMREVAANDPQGIVAQAMGLVEETARFDPTDPDQLAKIRRNADMLRGLVEGGSTAESQLARMRQNRRDGDEELFRQMQMAAEGRSLPQFLEDYGYLRSASVTAEDVAATRDSGMAATKALAREATDDSASIIETFITGSRARAKQLLADERVMEGLGRGGLDLVQDTLDASRTLQALVEEQSKAAGRTLTHEDLLRGNGVSAGVQQEAQEAFRILRANTQEAAKRLSFGMVPGKGRDPENLKRAAMTDLERQALEERQQFENQFSSEEERANAAVDLLRSLTGDEQSRRMDVDVNRSQLIEALSEGNRSSLVAQSIRSRKGLIDLALKKGLFGKKTKADDLTDEEKLSVLGRLSKAELTDDERADVSRMQEEAEPLLDFGMDGLTASEITQDSLERIRRFRGAEFQSAAAEKQTLEVKTSGKVSIVDDRTAELDLTGLGAYDFVG